MIGQRDESAVAHQGQPAFDFRVNGLFALSQNQLVNPADDPLEPG